MNIAEAKEEIRNAMRAYFARDDYGEYIIPAERQRPVFLIGPPGIGKTAVMEQIAGELGVALVSYSMTHHTRQSALGLPFIVEKDYGGKTYSVSEYTMSEIIASVYDRMEETGLREGILFLDEINCVSETLSPAMLQFLQYKVFGRHRVPAGWIVVTAGNPPEYNSSVREFDVVTWDRLKRIDVEPDFDAWKTYALSRGVHPAVLSYLDVKRTDFYSIETTVDGRCFVTARGWTDLSDMLRLYERLGIAVTERLIAQYLQHPRIAKEFAVYYDLFNKYRSDYRIDRILAGEADAEILERAQKAPFDERLSLLGLLIDAVSDTVSGVCREELALTELLGALKDVRSDLARGGDALSALEAQRASREAALAAARRSGALTPERQHALRRAAAILGELRAMLLCAGAAEDAFSRLKADFDARVSAMRADAAKAGASLSHVFRFCEKAFGEGQEMLILVTELTASRDCARFIARYGCEEYYAHNRELLFYERQKEIISELDALDEAP